jgi:signal transduction histidine kinase
VDSAPIRIIIVEDEQAHAEAIRRAMEAAGTDADIQVAGTLREYREKVAAARPDIALIDLNLPDGRAVEVLVFPSESGPFPILIMTAYGNEQTAVEALKSGALDYIVKSSETFAAMPHTVVRALREWNLLQERKRAEEERGRTEIRLLQAQKLEAVGTLAGGIAHDFNNILGIIMGYAGLAEKELPENETTGRYIKELLKACHRAKDLIRQILYFSRTDDKLERQVLDIHPIIKEVIKFLKASLPSTIEIRQSIPSRNGLVFAHATQIHQVLTNLCTNAAQAMEETGGTLEVSLTDVDLDPVTVQLHSDIKPGPYLKLTVADTGHGMDSVTLERIFDPYFTTKEVGKGSGLGLAVVHGIVKSHEGAITVYSEVGKGTMFHVYLPRIESELTTSEESSSPILRGTECILFVDDEALLVDIWEKTLAPMGYRVVTGTSSLEALELFRAHPDYFDLVITDYTIPHMNGLDLAKQMLRIRPDIPIILCTGRRETKIGEKIREAGIRTTLMKPLELRETAEAIRKVLDEKKQRNPPLSHPGKHH